MAEVVLSGVDKVYDDGTVAVQGLCLEVADGELVVLVGPSGCGKTSALRMVAGLEEITRGTIRIGSEVINDVHPGKRDIAMVFQNYALYPHMTVRENIGFPLRLARVRRRKRDAQVARVAKTLGLESHLMKKPRQLSGGQRQRVAMGRAIIREPRVFLMDEPLSNLDAKLRVQMRAEIAGLQRELGVTTIYVTHDQVEAMTMADRVAVMRRGELQQVGPPQEIYTAPTNLFVAAFIGSPAMNLIEGVVEPVAGSLGIRLGTQRLRLDDLELRRQPSIHGFAGGTVVVGVRPEHLTDEELGTPASGRTIDALATLREPLGADVLIHLTVAGVRKLRPELFVLAHDIEDPTEVESVALDEPEAILVARFGPTTSARSGDRLMVHLRPGGLLFFDPSTGLAL